MDDRVPPARSTRMSASRYTHGTRPPGPEPAKNDRGDRRYADPPALGGALRYLTTLHGTGEVELAAYGTSDAEATLEKGLRRILPGAVVSIRGVRRTAPDARIVESFAVRLGVRFQRSVDAETEVDARRAALRWGREAVRGTRFEKLMWGRVEVTPLAGGGEAPTPPA